MSSDPSIAADAASRKKIGILLAFPPRTPLSHEGIGRLLTMLLNARHTTPDANDMLLAAPRWSKPDIEKLLKDNDILPEQIETFYTPDTPLFMHMIAFAERFRGKGGGRVMRFLRKAGRRTGKVLGRVVVLMLSSRSLIAKLVFVPLMVATVLFLLVLAGWTISQSLFWALLLGLLLVTLLPRLWTQLMRALPHLFPKQAARIQAAQMKMGQNVSGRFRALRRNPFSYDLFLRIRQMELDRLIGQINRRDDVGMWYIPTAFWPEVKDIHTAKVIAVPDVVFIDFPTLFTTHNFSRTHDLIRETLETPGAYFLSYSHQVADRHLARGFGVNPHRTRVIYHGRSEMGHHLQDKSFPADMPMRARALSILRSHQQEFFAGNPYLRNFDFSHTRFFIFASQARPYKNILQLLEAHRRLLRRHRIDAKLFLTASINEIPEIANYIQKHRLGLDVLSFHGVPSRVLAAMNHLAIASIHPSLFEGGFPFTFSEAYSVGTPSLMSQTPHVMEIIGKPEIDPDLRRTMLFDPYDADAIAAKMAWVIDHRQELLAQQQSLYDHLYSWDDATRLYLDYFRDVMKQPGTAPVKRKRLLS